MMVSSRAASVARRCARPYELFCRENFLGLFLTSCSLRSSLSQKAQVRLLERIEELRVLSALSEAGLLSGAEKAGVFSKLEKAGAFSSAEKLLPTLDNLKVLSTAEALLNVPASNLFGLAAVLLIGGARRRKKKAPHPRAASRAMRAPLACSLAPACAAASCAVVGR